MCACVYGVGFGGKQTNTARFRLFFLFSSSLFLFACFFFFVFFSLAVALTAGESRFLFAASNKAYPIRVLAGVDWGLFLVKWESAGLESFLWDCILLVV